MKKLPRIPQTTAVNQAWRRYLLVLARECGKAGYREEKRAALHDARITRLDINYFMPDGKEPF